MLDEFIWGKVRRISPEAPVPVVEIVRERHTVLAEPANVAANIVRLGRTPIPVGVVGPDPAAERIISSARDWESKPGTGPGRSSDHCEDPHHRAQPANRPRGPGEQKPLPANSTRSLQACFCDTCPKPQVIVSDYDKGVVSRELFRRSSAEARAQDSGLFLDPKVHHADYYRPITLITPNHAKPNC